MTVAVSIGPLIPAIRRTASRGLATMSKAHQGPLKTVLVAGGSYAGHEAAGVLSQLLPPSHRVVLLERNSHFNHVYAFPRVTVAPGQEHKVFIPYTNVFKEVQSRHEYVQATLTSIDMANDGQGVVSFARTNAKGEVASSTSEERLSFDYMLYALGSHRPGSINLWSSTTFTGSKPEGIVGLQQVQNAVKTANSIVIVGAGPLGVEFAGDIADVYRGQKDVTLISSRQGVLPRLNEKAQETTLNWLRGRGINVVLGERLQGEPSKEDGQGKMVVHTNKGSRLEADVVLDCRGLTPNTTLLTSLLGEKWDASRAARQNAHLQLLPAQGEEPFRNVYVAGDAGEAFGAHKDGKNAREQAGIASRNIVRQIALQQQTPWASAFLQQHGTQLEEYKPPALRIKVTLGLSDAIAQSDGSSNFRQGEPGSPNINVEKHWKNRGLPIDDMFI